MYKNCFRLQCTDRPFWVARLSKDNTVTAAPNKLLLRGNRGARADHRRSPIADGQPVATTDPRQAFQSRLLTRDWPVAFASQPFGPESRVARPFGARHAGRASFSAMRFIHFCYYWFTYYTIGFTHIIYSIFSS